MIVENGLDDRLADVRYFDGNSCIDITVRSRPRIKAESDDCYAKIL